MPKTYLRGKNKRQYGSYDKEVIEKAIKGVKDGATISSVAKMYTGSKEVYSVVIAPKLFVNESADLLS